MRLTDMPRMRLIDVAGLLVLGLFAFLCAFEAGQRGFFPFDQSIVFDGGYRIASGQVPYKDFLLWTGPVAYVLQAMFFKWLGVNYTAYLASAAVFNVAAAWLAVVITRMLFPSIRLLSYAAGALTAIWFYPPFGTFAAEQTAFFFSLAALWLALCAGQAGRERRLVGPALACGAGVLAVVAVLSKQHAGLYMLPLYPMLFWIADVSDPRRATVHCMSFGLGVVLSLFAFWWWLWAAADVQHFVQYVLKIPAQLGWERIFRKGIEGLLKGFLIGVGPRIITAVVIGMEVISFLVVWIVLRRANGRREPARLELLAALICVYLTHFQHLLTYTMDNQSIIGLPFIGVIVAMGLGLLRRVAPWRWGLAWSGGPATAIARIGKAAAAAVVILSLGVSSVVGLRVAFTREAHDIFAHSVFLSPIALPTLNPVRWGRPTVLHEMEIREEDVVRLHRDLMARERNFFIFPDFTVFYGLTGRPSPQPILTFKRGVTYPMQYDPVLDDWIVASLERHHVEVVVLEEVSYDGPESTSRDPLNHFPTLQTYLSDAFRESDRIGIFTIYEKKG